MEWVDKVLLHLHLRMKGGKNTWNEGMKIIDRHEQIFMPRLQKYVEYGMTVITNNLELVDDTPKAKLTPVSIQIGREMMRNVKCTKDPQDNLHVLLGDFIVEGFFQTGLIDIQVPPPRSSTPVFIVPQFELDQIPTSDTPPIRGLYSEPPGDLPLIQKVKFKDGMEFNVPLIKRWGVEDELAFVQSIRHTEAYKAACQIANTGWVVNPRVLEVISKKPEAFFTTAKIKDKDLREKNFSKRIEYQRTKYTAEQVGSDVVYFSPEFDYRGRLYFTCPFFNFQGTDLARGLLLFCNKKYVNSNGLRWMKIHAATSYNQSYPVDEIPAWCTSDYRAHLCKEGLDNISVDKMTLEDRELWVDHNWDLIEQTVEEGKLHGEKPVSFLAVAYELTDYFKVVAIGGMFFSALPIPVDGSNNGWQHLGAISKDELTGKLVGLVPQDIQSDFYVSTGMELFNQINKQDQLDILNNMPMKHIRKAISKRGSMTRAYSAGAQKIAENMYQDCKKENFDHKYGITEKDCKVFALGLVKAIDVVCPGPLQTMKYLQRLAEKELESRDFLAWVTPAGFPVDYHCYHTRNITVVGRIRGVNPKSRDQVGHKVQITSKAPDKRGFMCGISPNFIHSQDAAHMCKVITAFGKEFGAVHDSFSAHASDVDELVEITKQEFIEMYDHDDYFVDIEDRLSPNSGIQQPKLGKLNIKGIQDSDYFFA